MDLELEDPEAIMANNRQGLCKVEGCSERVPQALAADGMCLDHFVDGTYARARRAVEAAQSDLPLEAGAFEWMFEDAKLALKALVRESEQPYREGVTELIAALANVHEYLRQQVAEPSRRTARALESAVSEYTARRAAGHGRA